MRSEKGLSRLLLILAVIPIATGVIAFLGGSDAIIDSGEVTPTVESELRFYSVWWIGVGLYLAAIARRPLERGRELRIVAGLLFLAGIGRMLAVIDTDWPHGMYVVFMAIELTLPVLIVVWHARLAGRADVLDKR